MVNINKKPSPEFNLFVSECLFGANDSDRKIEHGFYISSLLYHNNIKHMFLICGGIHVNKDSLYLSTKQQFSDNEYGVFIVTSFNNKFASIIAHDKNAKCVCGDYSMFLSYYKYSYCSLNCQKRQENKQIKS